MSEESAVDRLYTESIGIIQALAGEPSLQSAAGDNFRKSLLLASASHFEHRLTKLVLEFAAEATKGSKLIGHLIRTKAIDRQYHAWFDWDKNNANKFFSLFGPDFRTRMTNLITARDDLRGAMLAFLELGNDRNRLVHQDYATFPLEKTLDEIYGKYKQALPFINALPTELRECDMVTRETQLGSA